MGGPQSRDPHDREYKEEHKFAVEQPTRTDVPNHYKEHPACKVINRCGRDGEMKDQARQTCNPSRLERAPKCLVIGKLF